MLCVTAVFAVVRCPSVYTQLYSHIIVEPDLGLLVGFAEYK